MSIESAKAFLERVKVNDELAKRITSAASREERAAIVKEEGFVFSPEELKAVTRELTSEELQAVAGGMWCGQTHESESPTCMCST